MWSMPVLCGCLILPRTLPCSKMFRFVCKTATYNWGTNCLMLTELPTLEKRRLELKLCHMFKIVHDLCYFRDGLVTIRECMPSVK